MLNLRPKPLTLCLMPKELAICRLEFLKEDSVKVGLA